MNDTGRTMTGLEEIEAGRTPRSGQDNLRSADPPASDPQSELRETLRRLDYERDLCRGKVEELQDEIRGLRAVLTDLYPVLAGRTIQLQEAGEERAAERWNGYCVKVREALDGRP